MKSSKKITHATAKNSLAAKKLKSVIRVLKSSIMGSQIFRFCCKIFKKTDLSQNLIDNLILGAIILLK